MPPSPRQPSSVTVPCRCGAFHIISVMHFGRLQTCKKCGSGYSVVWKRDPKSNKPVPLVVASAKPRKSSRPATPPESMIEMACGCGYKRKITPEELRKGPSCPGCGKPMYVDRPARPKKPPEPLRPYIEPPRFAKAPTLPPRSTPPPFKAPTPPAFEAPTRPPSSGSYPKPPSSGSYPKPPSSGSIPVPRASGETRVTQSGKILVICSLCGDRLLVSADRQGGQVKCMRCETVLTVGAAPAAPAPPPPVEEEAVFAPFDSEMPEADPAASRPVPEFLDGPTLGCPCGAELDVRGASPGSEFNCEACGRRVTMQKARHPQTLSTIMKPIFAEPEIVIDTDASDVICACGEALLVSSQDLGHPLQCPGCSVLLEVQRTAGGLQVKPIGRIDEQDWSLQDFS
jgi:hypothetical protein